MTAIISEDHRVLIEGVRDYARGALLARDREWDRTETSCCELLDEYAEMGLMGLRVPESDGGIACPMVPYAHIIRELSYASPSVAVTIAVHTMVCEIIKMYAAEGVRDKLLSQLATTGNLSAFAISEPDAGSDPTMVRTRAEKVDWRLPHHGAEDVGYQWRQRAVVRRAGAHGQQRQPQRPLHAAHGREPGGRRAHAHPREDGHPRVRNRRDGPRRRLRPGGEPAR